MTSFRPYSVDFGIGRSNRFFKNVVFFPFDILLQVKMSSQSASDTLVLAVNRKVF